MKQWIHLYVSAIIIMIAIIWSSIVEKIIPEIAYIEMVLSGMIIVLLVYLPVLIKMAESRTYKTVEATFSDKEGWEVTGSDTSEGNILNSYVKEGWQLKGAIGTDQSPDKAGRKKRYYYLCRNW